MPKYIAGLRIFYCLQTALILLGFYLYGLDLPAHPIVTYFANAYAFSWLFAIFFLGFSYPHLPKRQLPLIGLILLPYIVAILSYTQSASWLLSLTEAAFIQQATIFLAFTLLLLELIYIGIREEPLGTLFIVGLQGLFVLPAWAMTFAYTTNHYRFPSWELVFVCIAILIPLREFHKILRENSILD